MSLSHGQKPKCAYQSASLHWHQQVHSPFRAPMDMSSLHIMIIGARARVYLFGTCPHIGYNHASMSLRLQQYMRKQDGFLG